MRCNGRFGVYVKAEDVSLKNIVINNVHPKKKGYGFGLVLSEDTGKVKISNIEIQSTQLNMVQHAGDVIAEKLSILYGTGVVISSGKFSCTGCQWRETVGAGINLTPDSHESLTFKLTNSSFRNTKGNAVYITQNAKGVLKNINFSDGENGIFIKGSRDVSLEQVSFRNYGYALMIDGGAEVVSKRFSVSNMKKFAVASLGIGTKLTLVNSNFENNPKIGEAGKQGIIVLKNITYYKNAKKFLSYSGGKFIEESK